MIRIYVLISKESGECMETALVTVLHDPAGLFLKAFSVHMPKLKKIYQMSFLALSDESDDRLESIAEENAIHVIRIPKRELHLQGERR